MNATTRLRLSLCLLTLLLVPGCVPAKSSKVIQPAGSSPAEGKLKAFFSMCERDNTNAVNVIRDRDLIKNLTHLHKMNAGGKRYYLLEREAITEMIRSVTEGIYTDFILINRHGVILYTMSDDEIFGKNVKTALSWSPLLQCFNMEGQAAHLEDVIMFPPLSDSYSMFIAMKVVKENEMEGVFVLQVTAGKILPLLEPGTSIISRDGKYRINARSEMMLAPFPYLNRINLEALSLEKTVSFTADKKFFECYPFEYRNLYWIIVSER